MLQGLQRKQTRLFYLLMVVMILIGLPIMALAATPTDIGTHWAKSQITDWVNKGMVNGYPDGTFQPGKVISRAEFMALVNGAFGFHEKAETDYSDVPAGAWFADTVAAAKAAGYIAGYSDGTIKPSNAISRQEAATVIMKIKELTPNIAAADQFSDIAQIPGWSLGAVGTVVDAKIMGGYPDGTFKAGNFISRAEAVVALDRALNFKAIAATYFDQAGTFGPANGKQVIEGNVVVSAAGVYLQNVTIKGNLTLAKSIADGNVTLKNVTVIGSTEILGGGENSIIIIDSTLGNVRVYKENGKIRIVVSGTTTISEIYANSGVKLEEKNLTGDGFGEVVLDAEDSDTIILIGIFDTVEIKSEGLTINIPTGSTIGILTLDETAAVTGQGTVTQAEVNADGVTFEKAPQDTETGTGVQEPTVTAPTSGGSHHNSSVAVSAITDSDLAITAGSVIFGYTFAGSSGSVTYEQAQSAPYYLNTAASTVTITDGTNSAFAYLKDLGIGDDGTVEYADLSVVQSKFDDLDFIPTQIQIHLVGATSVNSGADAWNKDVTVDLTGDEIALLTPGANMTAYTAALAAVDEADYTTASWDAYQIVVGNNMVTDQDLQADVDAATQAIIDAQADLLLLADMTAYNAALAAVDEADYTTASWDAYQIVVGNNMVTDQDLQGDVDAATGLIIAAQADLNLLANMTDYTAALAAVDEADYTTASWDAYQIVVGNNTVTDQDLQGDVDAATQAITDAQDDLLLLADMTDYNAALAAVDEADYTAASWADYEVVLAANIVTDQDLQGDVDAATGLISAAQADLNLLAIMTDYTAALAAVDEADYTTASWADYEVVLAANIVTDQDTQGDVDAATGLITAAQADLDLLAIMTDYTAALAAVDEADYTTASWADYEVVLAANIVTDQDTQGDVDAATGLISAAQADLDLLAIMTAYNAALAAVDEADYTTASWEAYQIVVGNNIVTDQDLQGDVDAATQAITDAQDDLLLLADMTDYTAALAAVIEENYTTASWADYEIVLAANIVTDQDTQGDVDTATGLIIAAQANLDELADMTAYTAALAAVDQADYTTASWDAYQIVVGNNAVTNQDPQEDVDTATGLITAAQADLDLLAIMTDYTAALAAVDEADYTTASWAAYQIVVGNNTVTNQDPQGDVDAATGLITAAQADLDLLANMTAYTAALAAVDEADYTTASWAAYQIVVGNNTVTNQDPQGDVDTATGLIIAAQADLDLLAIMTDYTAALAAVDEADYTTASWTDYEVVLAANIVTDQDTQGDVDAATGLIIAAQADLDLLAIMTDYTAALAAVDEADYTTASWADYEVVLAANIVTDQDTQGDVDAATGLIIAAQADLDLLANMTAYTAALAAVDEADYTTASWDAYQIVVGNNTVTNQDPQGDVDTATGLIIAAQADLDGLSDMTAYTAALAAVDEADYTTASWTDYEVVLAANVVTGRDTQADVNAATGNIIAAQVDLVTVEESSVATVKGLVSGNVYAMAQADATNEAAVKAAIEAEIATLALDGVTPVVTKILYTAAIAGDHGTPAGTNGAYTFTVNLTKGAASDTTATLTMTVTATAANLAEFTGAEFDSMSLNLTLTGLSNVEPGSTFDINKITYSDGNGASHTLTGTYTPDPVSGNDGQYYFDFGGNKLTINLTAADESALLSLPDVGIDPADNVSAATGWTENTSNTPGDSVNNISVTIL